MTPRKPSVKMIDKVLGEVLHHEGRTAKEVRDAMDGVVGKSSLDEAMKEVNWILEGHGVEPIRDPDSYDPYYGDVVALYVNMGDTYNATVLFDIPEWKFEVTTWGDWVEKVERQGRYKLP